MGWACGENREHMELLYEQWLRDPESCSLEWRAFFEGMHFAGVAEVPAQSEVHELVQAYRMYGHLAARVNPLVEAKVPPELELSHFGFSVQDLTRLVSSEGFFPEEKVPLQQLLSALQETYCGPIGIEYMEIRFPEVQQFIQTRIEPNRFHQKLAPEQKRTLLEIISRTELFEIFLHTRFTGQKRFSLEGTEALLPVLHTLMERGSEEGLRHVVLGMAHRGRLNVLHTLLKRPFSLIFHEFDERYLPYPCEGSGDVKYHRGFSGHVRAGQHEVFVTALANPSHLEAVDPVVEGVARALQDRHHPPIPLGSSNLKQVIAETHLSIPLRREELPILIHGDASVAGQGVVYETLQMSRLRGYTTGGTIHVVINNQVGFTATPEQTRSTLYATDLARAFDSPVLHVNAEDVEACVAAARLAIEVRQRFGLDVFIDLIGYRRYGHNEGDEPAFTQPIESAEIRGKDSARVLYRNRLLAEGSITTEDAERFERQFQEALVQELEESQTLHQQRPSMTLTHGTSFISTHETQAHEASPRPPLGSCGGPVHEASPRPPLGSGAPQTPLVEGDGMRSFVQAEQHVQLVAQAHPPKKAELEQLALRLTSCPEGFHPHPKVARLLEQRRKNLQEGMDWAWAETLAFASLLVQGIPVRLSGQDVGRGTFSQRHAVWTDQETGKTWSPLQHLSPSQGLCSIWNSHLSEYAVVGFEYGYSLFTGAQLVIWEAQFGDFANGAQILIDQFIASGERKWGRLSGLTMLLPHGYEGQGPEHSSGRPERFLQLCAEENLRVAVPSTPAQHYHLLREQALLEVPHPLVIFTPKANLRLPAATSTLQDLAEGGFSPLLLDPLATVPVRRLVFCTGKIWYELQALRQQKMLESIALVRLEQLYPFPDLQPILEAMNPSEVVWVQEEPENQGYWSFLRSRLPAGTQYCGRPPAAATAVGSHALHKQQQNILLHQALGLEVSA